jgi:hypothetical protein
MQHQGMRSRRHNGVVNAKATLDLIIIDVPEDLHIPTVSDPTNVGSLGTRGRIHFSRLSLCLQRTTFRMTVL